jgi:hypothetical protein
MQIACRWLDMTGRQHAAAPPWFGDGPDSQKGSRLSHCLHTVSIPALLNWCDNHGKKGGVVGEMSIGGPGDIRYGHGEDRFRQLTAETNSDHVASQAGYQPLLSRLRCWLEWHDWREVETPDHDKFAECARCGKRDWRRHLRLASGGWHGGDLPPGA